jgi:zinc-ribbon domain/Phospholipase_D-nuclease N-terminal
MKLRQFLNIIPKAVRVWAWILAVLPLLIGLVVGYVTSDRGTAVWTIIMFGSAGLVFGIFLATWLLCLGFVFADARRRGMPAVLWVLVATFFPHLLGFLLYFVMRQPIAVICSHCGMTVSNHQRFCSWCGTEQLQPNSNEGPLAANPS